MPLIQRRVGNGDLCCQRLKVRAMAVVNFTAVFVFVLCKNLLAKIVLAVWLFLPVNGVYFGRQRAGPAKVVVPNV